MKPFGECIFPTFCNLRRSSDWFVFRSPYVRNSCTQLFSTVMSRVFRPSGIQAAASHSTIPADEFLFSNQKLYTRLMEIFCAVVREDTLQSYLSPGLFPSLILITRLGATRTSQLSDLSSILLEICYKSPIAKVREVAAVTVTKTTPGSELQSLVISAWAQVVESEHVMNENRLHGILVLSLKVAGSTASPETLDQLRIEVSRRKWMIGSRQSSYNRYYFLKLVSALNMPELLDVSIVAISSHVRFMLCLIKEGFEVTNVLMINRSTRLRTLGNACSRKKLPGD